MLLDVEMAKAQSTQIIIRSAVEEPAIGSSRVVEEREEPPPTKKRKLLTFLQKSSATSEESGSLTQEERLKKELEAYLLCPKLSISSHTSVLEWWKTNENNYPNLATLARKYLCICATSCPSERTFSTSGNIVTAKRAITKPDKINMLVFLAKNMD